MSEKMTMHERNAAELNDAYELMFVDYRDEMPDDYYPTLLSEGREAWWRLLEDVDTWYDRIESAYFAVEEAARSAGYNLSSPFVSIDPDEHWNLVETVLERDTSDAKKVVMQLARRDQVLLGYTLSDEWHDYTADDLEHLAEQFGAAADEEWLGPVMGQGEGHPVVLFAVSGDDLLDLFYRLYEAEEGEQLEVRIRYQDAGLLNRMSGSGWIEDLPEQRTLTVTVDEFLSRAWVDNDPRASTTWTAVTGGARAASEGMLEVVQAVSV